MPLKHATSARADAVAAVLLAESFGAGANLEQVRQRLDCVARHARPALTNALEVERLPLQWLTRPLANFRTGLSGGGRLSTLVFVTVLLACSAFLAFFPLPLKSEATGELVPVERRIVYAPFNGKIVHLAMQHGDRVDKGQELLFIEDLETQLKVDQLSVRITAANERLRLLEEHLSKPLAPKDHAEFLNDRIRTQYELGKSKVERDLLLSENASPRKSPVFAPLTGQVLTFDAKEKLLGKTVKTGDPLLRLGCTNGPWEVELYIPEKEAARVRAAIFRAAPDSVDVDLLLASDPTRVYRGAISLKSLAGETTVRNDKIVLAARVTIADSWLRNQLETMPVGVEVHARIRCGTASAGHVWFDEIWNFLYERLVF
jgi:biotin carboxyl carrier protein